jgi:hypothetical protein
MQIDRHVAAIAVPKSSGLLGHAHTVISQLIVHEVVFWTTRT